MDAECTFVVPVSDIAGVPLLGIGANLASRRRKTAGSVTISELASLQENPNGVYLFYGPAGQLMYVGKASSRSFIERVPAHFDPREEAWMNSLCKRLMKANTCAYPEALAEALTLELLLIGTARDSASRVESVLRAVLKPILNTSGREFDMSLTLGDAADLDASG